MSQSGKCSTDQVNFLTNIYFYLSDAFVTSVFDTIECIRYFLIMYLPIEVVFANIIT